MLVYEEISVGDTIAGTFEFKEAKITGMFGVLRKNPKEKSVCFQFKHTDGTTLSRFIRLSKFDKNSSLMVNDRKAPKQANENNSNVVQGSTRIHVEGCDVDTDVTIYEIMLRISLGIKNIQLVGPAGCGKTVITGLVAKKLNIPNYVISCGEGTSATEFLGYKYPDRHPTKFAGFYKKPSIITLDEFTALDPSVAQVTNAALANGFIETTTVDPEVGSCTIPRHDDCIIIATSNTFGSGGSAMYTANNQLDAATRDRFTGGIVQVGYSEQYESRYNSQVVAAINLIRDFLNKGKIHRVASTRMVQSGHKYAEKGMSKFLNPLLVDWSIKDLKALKAYAQANGGSAFLNCMEWKV